MFDDFDFGQSDDFTPNDYSEEAIVDEYDIDNCYYLEDYYRDFSY